MCPNRGPGAAGAAPNGVPVFKPEKHVSTSHTTAPVFGAERTRAALPRGEWREIGARCQLRLRGLSAEAHLPGERGPGAMNRPQCRRTVLCAAVAPFTSLTPASSAAPEDRRPPSERVLLLSQFAAGAISGIANVVLFFPFDTVKVRIQAQARAGRGPAAAMPRYNGLGHALRVMLREEGWRSYYRGTLGRWSGARLPRLRAASRLFRTDVLGAQG
jgi:hypothetical protein